MSVDLECISMIGLPSSVTEMCNVSTHYQYFPTDIQSVATQSALIMVNIPISLFGTLANSLIIMAYYRNPRLRTIQNKIFLQLAITDFGVTAFVQPILVIATLNGFLRNHYCILWGLEAVSKATFVEMSLITIVILSLQSYITLAYPYHWQSMITKYRLNIVFLISWILTTIKSFAVFSNWEFVKYWILCVICLAIITVSLIWTWTYKLVARHRFVIQSTQTPSSENVEQKKIVRSTVTALAVVLSLVICYMLDIFIIMFDNYFNASKLGRTMYGTVCLVAVTSMFLNSLLNPCLLFWRNTPFREAVKNIFG